MTPANVTDETTRAAGWRHRTGRVVLIVLGVLGLLCALAPVLAPVGPEAGSLSETLRRPRGPPLARDGRVGRDVLARLLWGGRVTLSVVLLVTIAAPGRRDGVRARGESARRALGEGMMRLVDGLLGVPRLPLYLVLLTLVGPGYWSVVIVMVAFEWPAFARLAYSGRSGRQREAYVEAARARGAARAASAPSPHLAGRGRAAAGDGGGRGAARGSSPRPRSATWGSGSCRRRQAGATCWPRRSRESGTIRPWRSTPGLRSCWSRWRRRCSGTPSAMRSIRPPAQPHPPARPTREG